MPADKNKKNKLLLIFDDTVMMVALLLNIVLILFEWLFSYPLVQTWLRLSSPDGVLKILFYIHHNFVLIDLCFVVFYLAEFFLTWIVAAKNRWYDEWFYYPFVHWYDLLGCIPVGSLRFLRILRIFSVVIRLHIIGIIDLRKTALFRQLKKWQDILVEEVSDRVVVNALSGVQREMEAGGTVVERVVDEVLKPNQEVLAERLSRRLSETLAVSYHENKEGIENYIQATIESAFRKNNEIELIKSIPMVGKRLAEVLEGVIIDIISNVVDKGIGDLSGARSKAMVNEALNAVTATTALRPDPDRLRDFVIKLLIEAIDIVKDQVKRKKWKEDLYLQRELDFDPSP
ncbi:MAG: ion transporter [Deltaproteobacteria bacterium]|nr:ion transporter [Deltaproteobacteria bacterium]